MVSMKSCISMLQDHNRMTTTTRMMRTMRIIPTMMTTGTMIVKVLYAEIVPTMERGCYSRYGCATAVMDQEAGNDPAAAVVVVVHEEDDDE